MNIYMYMRGFTTIINIFTFTVRGSTLDLRIWRLQTSKVDLRAVGLRAYIFWWHFSLCAIWIETKLHVMQRWHVILLKRVGLIDVLCVLSILLWGTATLNEVFIISCMISCYLSLMQNISDIENVDIIQSFKKYIFCSLIQITIINIKLHVF